MVVNLIVDRYIPRPTGLRSARNVSHHNVYQPWISICRYYNWTLAIVENTWISGVRKSSLILFMIPGPHTGHFVFPIGTIEELWLKEITRWAPRDHVERFKLILASHFPRVVATLWPTENRLGIYGIIFSQKNLQVDLSGLPLSKQFCVNAPEVPDRITSEELVSATVYLSRTLVRNSTIFPSL